MTAKVWDAFVRLFHWSVVALVAAAFASSDRRALVDVHAAIGLAIAALVAARVAWGFVGPRNARFATFVRGPREVVAYARAMLRGKPPMHVSHNPLGGAMAVAVIAVIAGLAVTGALAWAGRGGGVALPAALRSLDAHAVKELHEALSSVLLALVGVHVAGVLASSVLERQNLVLGMITGMKRVPDAAAAADPSARPAPARSGGARRRMRYAGAAAIGLALLAGGAVVGSAAAHADDREEGSDDEPERAHAEDEEARAGRHGGAEHRGHDDDEDRRPSSSPSGGAATAADPVYVESCGACHLPYPPRLLPASSWRGIVGQLPRHFRGEAVELEPAARARIEAWLVANAAPNAAGAAPAPTRITDQAWFRREHRELPAGVTSRPSIGSMSRCDACHTTAKSWDFGEHSVKIPAR